MANLTAYISENTSKKLTDYEKINDVVGYTNTCIGI